MNSIRALAMQHIGQRVVVHSRMGIHQGILHHCDENGMYLQLLNQHQMVSYSQQDDGHMDLNSGTGQIDVALAWLPFFFIPWAAAYAFSPWGWWW